MPDVLAENLSGKAVMGSDGTEFGMLYNITMDPKTGTLRDLLVSPDDEIDAERSSFEYDDDGRIHIPVGRVKAVKDYIVVQQ